MTDPDKLVGQTYTWHTGLTATVRGYAQDVSKSGNASERLALILQSESPAYPPGPHSLIVYPYSKFVAARHPWDELEITGSGHETRVFGPKPVTARQLGEAIAPALTPGDPS